MAESALFCKFFSAIAAETNTNKQMSMPFLKKSKNACKIFQSLRRNKCLTFIISCAIIYLTIDNRSIMALIIFIDMV
jgi:hypothetical protein